MEIIDFKNPIKNGPEQEADLVPLIHDVIDAAQVTGIPDTLKSFIADWLPEMDSLYSDLLFLDEILQESQHDQTVFDPELDDAIAIESTGKAFTDPLNVLRRTAALTILVADKVQAHQAKGLPEAEAREVVIDEIEGWIMERPLDLDLAIDFCAEVVFPINPASQLSGLPSN